MDDEQINAGSEQPKFENADSSWISHPFKIVKKITVEPLLFISMTTIVMYSIVAQQYIYWWISKSYGIENTTQAFACGTNNVTNETYQLQQKVSSETSTWVLYLNVAGFIPSFFCTILIGTWGDTVGRRPPLICSFLGLLAMIIVHVVVIHYELHVAYLLIARIVAGLSGDLNAIFSSCYAYIADVSSHKDRTVRVAIGEASTGLGGFIASVGSGVWIDAQGYEPPLWLLFALLILCIFYIILILPESHKPPSSSSLSACGKCRSLFTCKHYVGIWRFLSENWNRSIKLLGIIFCFFLQLCVHDGTGDTIIVYELSRPLCWSSSLIGYGSGVRDSAYLFGVITVKVLNGRLTDLLFIFISSLSTICGLFMYAFATFTWMMFLGYSFAILRTVSATVLRSMISRLVSSDEQGSAFALIACAEATASLVASFIFNGVYSATVGTFPGAVFIVGVGIQVVFFFIASFVYTKTKSDLAASQAEEYHQFQVGVMTELSDQDSTAKECIN